MFQPDAHQQLEKKYSLPGIRAGVDVSACDAMARFNIEQLESALLVGLDSGVLRADQLRGKGVDFGCGRGVSTGVLARCGAEVTGIELEQHSIDEGKSLKVVPHERILHGDGIAYLRSLPAGSLDFINASMLGPDLAGRLCREFLLACAHALKPGGTVMVTSDVGTLSTLSANNSLGNGFVQNGVFLAIRGLSRDSQIASDKFDLGLERLGSGDLRSFLDRIDLDGFMREFKG